MNAKLALALVAVSALIGCLLVTTILHEPVPRIHDEFSYMLMADTFSEGRVSNPAPPLPEFFDTFHVLVRPRYVSKYFPGQGVFMAVGIVLTGHPAVGVWLSSALACGATVWMLEAWLNTGWALLGGFLMLVQYGIFSYWSQAYWGGMVAALGGALFFGALRRLWERLSWGNAVWLGMGIVILVNSRPLEGLLAAFPATALLAYRLWRSQRWRQPRFWPQLVLPCLAILGLGVFATGAYNHAITGSAVKTPYMLHELQYQEAPPLIFLPLRPKLTYSSPIIQYYYEVNEMKPYVTERVPKYLMSGIVRKLATWWAFYCGILMSIPLVVPGILRKGWTRWAQVGVIAGLLVLSYFSTATAVGVRGLIDLLVFIQVVILWVVFEDFWSRLALATCVLVLLLLCLTKWLFPHYFAPAACLILFLQVEGLRRIWFWSPRQQESSAQLSRAERRRIKRENEARTKPNMSLRWVVYLLPAVCVISLIGRVEARLNGWQADPLGGPDRQALLMDDWSLDRASIQKWLEQQPKPQLVFVRYWQNHNINFEWVYNHPDIMHSHVIWARDLGPEHNKLLLNLVPDRTVWLIEADRKHPQLIPYEQAISRPTEPNPGRFGNGQQQETEQQ